MKKEKILIKGAEVSILTMGEGSPFLILHGWGSKAEKWQRVGELLAEKGYKVIIPDLPGFGETKEPKEAWGIEEYASFIEEFIGRTGLPMGSEKFCLLGHSFGGALAVKIALRHPEKVRKMYLTGAALSRKRTFRKRVLFVLSKALKIFSFLPFAKKAFYRFIVRRSDYPWQKGIMKESYLKIIKEDLTGVLSNIKVPTVLIWGEKDNVTPLEDAYLIKEKIKGSKLEIIKGAGHDLEITHPEELAKIIWA